jgi:DNA (cytosine-5)-methyltransferase 1
VEPDRIPFLSICSGIEAVSVALETLGFVPVGFSEIDRDASAVLAHRFGSNMPGEPLSSNGVPNHGDFTAIEVDALPIIKWLIGGTPCQAFSVAGSRRSLADARGNLTLAYAVLAHELVRRNELEGALWENVPGVLSTKDNAFGCFLGALVGGDDPIEPVARPPRGKSNKFWRWRDAGTELDDDGNEVVIEEGHYTRWPSLGMVAGPLGRAAWRILDAQYFGLAQRRRRVFVVAGFGDEVDPAAILFEQKGMFGNHPPSREARKDVAGTLSARTKGGGGLGTDFEVDGGLAACWWDGGQVSETLDTSGGQSMPDKGRFAAVLTPIAHALRAEGFDASEDGTGRGTPLVPVAFQSRASSTQSMNPIEVAPSLDVAKAGGTAVAFDLRGRNGGAQFEGPHETANIRAASGGSSRSYVAALQGNMIGRSETAGPAGTGVDDSGAMFTLTKTDVHAIAHQWAVRRLTPVECERLQGFPDDWTLTPNSRGQMQADGPRYKQLGNSMAVPVIAWIGRRIIANRKPS